MRNHDAPRDIVIDQGTARFGEFCYKLTVSDMPPINGDIRVILQLFIPLEARSRSLIYIYVRKRTTPQVEMLSLLVCLPLSGLQELVFIFRCHIYQCYFCSFHMTVLCLGSSLTSGFPSLEELMRNGSLLERYSTYDGELRSVPGIKSTCSGHVGNRISKITFIALPCHQNGTGGLTLRVMRNPGSSHDIQIDQDAPSFSVFGYELCMSQMPPVMFNDGDRLLIRHGGSGPILLYQVGVEERNICRRFEPDSEICELDYDYPLLAIETGIHICIERHYYHRLVLVPLLFQILQGVLRDWCQHLN